MHERKLKTLMDLHVNYSVKTPTGTVKAWIYPFGDFPEFFGANMD